MIEETDESLYWLEVITEANLLELSITKPLIAEANELVSIFVVTAKTTKSKYPKS